MMRDIASFIMRIVSIILLPVFMVGFALYGARVWLWNWTNCDPYDGVWAFIIPPKETD